MTRSTGWVRLCFGNKRDQNLSGWKYEPVPSHEGCIVASGSAGTSSYWDPGSQRLYLGASSYSHCGKRKMTWLIKYLPKRDTTTSFPISCAMSIIWPPPGWGRAWEETGNVPWVGHPHSPWQAATASFTRHEFHSLTVELVDGPRPCGCWASSVHSLLRLRVPERSGLHSHPLCIILMNWYKCRFGGWKISPKEEVGSSHGSKGQEKRLKGVGFLVSKQLFRKNLESNAKNKMTKLCKWQSSVNVDILHKTAVSSFIRFKDQSPRLKFVSEAVKALWKCVFFESKL